ncbi:two-component system response regulator [Actinoplanes sp. NBRC 101535]|nr:two-component system response regulator [Actinoplanes sp. NBRC 101535]
MKTDLFQDNDLYRAPTSDKGKPTVLLVDTDEGVLRELVSQLGRSLRLVTATSGEQALQVLAESGPVAAVVCDLRLPGMDGIELLWHLQIDHPDTTRVLHTSAGDIDTAMAAINSGGVYRYLLKPASTGELRGAVHDAVAQNGQAVGERQLLDQTLRASIQALFGVLELASPVVFARAGRIRTLVAELCGALQLDAHWEIEVAAMAAQLGAVTVPPAVLQKRERGLPLNTDEQAMIDAMPRVAARLLHDIPNMQDVVAMILGLAGEPAPDGGRSPLVESGIGVMRTAIDFESLESRGITDANAISALDEKGICPQHVLTALRKVKGVQAAKDVTKTVNTKELEVGMRLAEDLVATNGLVLIGRGTVATEVMLDRLTNFARVVELVETVLVAVPDYQKYIVRRGSR